MYFGFPTQNKYPTINLEGSVEERQQEKIIIVQSQRSQKGTDFKSYLAVLKGAGSSRQDTECYF